jgi:hypothetical protein
MTAYLIVLAIALLPAGVSGIASAIAGSTPRPGMNGRRSMPQWAWQSPL